MSMNYPLTNITPLMKEPSLVSIIVPSYNLGRIIRNASKLVLAVFRPSKPAPH